MTPEQIRNNIHQILTDQYLWECDEIENSLVWLVGRLIDDTVKETLEAAQANARREALLEAASLYCKFCKEGNWTLTKESLGDFGYRYVHVQFGKQTQPICLATGIHELIAADQPGQGQGKAE